MNISNWSTETIPLKVIEQRLHKWPEHAYSLDLLMSCQVYDRTMDIVENQPYTKAVVGEVDVAYLVSRCASHESLSRQMCRPGSADPTWPFPAYTLRVLQMEYDIC